MTNTRSLLLTFMALTVGLFSLNGTRAAEEWDYSAEAEPLTRGPVHEAFAQPVSPDVDERFVIAYQPPESIQEIPPEEKPAGDNVVWIPGYWHYDDEANEFIWISGCWRAVPPGKSWVPGYWRETDGGFEWVVGFWKDAGARNIVYLPEPPQTLEQGPSASAPAPDSLWVPGCWVWQPGTFWRSGSYAWRPGFWVTARADWVWVPAHYVYTPHGYVFVEGYWDYVLPERGVAFLPMRFTSGVYLRTGFSFSPRLVVGVDLILGDLFFSPRRCHYYFGDYYAVHYTSMGYYPWFAVRHRVMFHDHLFVHARWRHRDQPDWSRQQRRDFDHRRQQAETRPPRTYRQYEERNRTRPDLRERDNRKSIRPIHDLARGQDNEKRFEKLDARQRDEHARRGRQVESYRQGRSKWETPASTSPDRKPRPVSNRNPGDNLAATTQRDGRPDEEPRGNRHPAERNNDPRPERESNRDPRPEPERQATTAPDRNNAPQIRERERPRPTTAGEADVIRPEARSRLGGTTRPGVPTSLPGYEESRARVVPGRTVRDSVVAPGPTRPQSVRVPESPVMGGSRSEDSMTPPPAPTQRRQTSGRSSSRSDGGRRKMPNRP